MTVKNADLQKAIGQRIMQCRGNDVSQEQLANEIGVSREVIQHWERGSRHIKADHLCKLAKHFGVSADWLLGLSRPLSGDPVKRAAEEYTGLSASAVENLQWFCTGVYTTPEQKRKADWFIASDWFHKLVIAMQEYEAHSADYLKRVQATKRTECIIVDDGTKSSDDLLRRSAKLDMMDVIFKIADEIDEAYREGESNGQH